MLELKYRNMYIVLCTPVNTCSFKKTHLFWNKSTLKNNFTDLGLGSVLTMSRVWIWTWIQFLLQFGSDSESIKFNGFGFGLGFNLFYGLGRIQNPLSLTDSDSDLDSTCSTGCVGFRIY